MRRQCRLHHCHDALCIVLPFQRKMDARACASLPPWWTRFICGQHKPKRFAGVKAKVEVVRVHLRCVGEHKHALEAQPCCTGSSVFTKKGQGRPRKAKEGQGRWHNKNGQALNVSG